MFFVGFEYYGVGESSDRCGKDAVCFEVVDDEVTYAPDKKTNGKLPVMSLYMTPVLLSANAPMQKIFAIDALLLSGITF